MYDIRHTGGRAMKPKNLHISTMAPYACDNITCSEYQLAKIVVFDEVAPNILAAPNLICSVCGNHVPRIKWGELDR